MSAKTDAHTLFTTAIAAVKPAQLIASYLQFKDEKLYINQKWIPLEASQQIFVIGAGKAVAAMAQEVEKVLGDRITKGLVVCKYQHALPLQWIECMEAAHPVPDQNSIKATDATIELLHTTNANDIILCLLSGGASSLWADIPDGITLEDLQSTFSILLHAGADILEMNIIRKHLSGIKGGQLLLHAPECRWFSLMISDVPDDQRNAIASGPTQEDPSTFADALLLIKKYQSEKKLPVSVMNHLEKGAMQLLPETIKEGHPVLKNVTNLLIGNNKKALDAAKNKAIEMGYNLFYCDNSMSGNVDIVGNRIVEWIRTYQGTLPACILLGGETTVEVTGTGKGGRNQHLALHVLKECLTLYGDITQPFVFLSAGTDGTDGPTDAAGAYIDSTLLSSVQHQLEDIRTYYENNDAYHFFKNKGHLIITGPTQTNVMDIVILLLYQDDQ